MREGEPGKVGAGGIGKGEMRQKDGLIALVWGSRIAET